MIKAYHEIRDIKQRHEGIDLRTASMISAIDKIAAVYAHRGIFP
jgi:glutamate dehydrogenase/leucine dehydrogenase